ncbi:MAG: hypothetical protein BroJett040_08470 [Oligoflexia bacterium]|nr:MAG: hypothetical protein BroJett040_08470 [Oligoflexia bacterium]
MAQLNRSKLQARELEVLVDEMLKKNPDQQIIQQLMSKYGMNYTKDPIEQMSTVLGAVGPLYKQLTQLSVNKDIEK